MAVSARVELSRGLKRALRGLSKAGVERAMRRGLDAVGAAIQSRARDAYLSGPRPSKLGVVTGALRRSITVDRSKLPRSVAVGTATVYGPIHEFGGEIRPKRAGLLSFRTRDGGFVRTRRVRMPARPFLGPALDDVSPDIDDIVLHEIEREAL